MGVGPTAGRAGEKIIFDLLSPFKFAAEITAKHLYKQSRKTWGNLSEQAARQRFRIYVNQLEKRGLIEKDGRGFKSNLKITKKGSARLDLISMHRITLKPGQKWDGEWHLVSFDIPENNRSARSALRRLLKELGCSFLHGSVWIHPLDFSEQVQVVQKIYGVDKHVTYFRVREFDRAGEFINKYKKLYKL